MTKPPPRAGDPPSAPPMGILLSYWYNRTPGSLRFVRERIPVHETHTPVRFLVDSGAFTADTKGHQITVDEFATWLDEIAYPQIGPWIQGVFNLDVLRDPVRSLRNWERLQHLGHDTIPVTHLGDPVDVIDQYAAAGATYIGLGAMVGRTPTRKTRWAAMIHRHVRDHHPAVRLHGLGIGGERLVEGLPWYSVDSSGFGASYRFGRLLVYDPYRGAWRRMNLLDRRDGYQHGRMLRDVYGVNLPDVGPNESGSLGAEIRPRLVRIAAQSVYLWQASMIRRKPLTPPTPDRHPGPLVFYADTGSDNIGMILTRPQSYIPEVLPWQPSSPS